MIKVEMKLDENKILSEKKYNLEDIYMCIDKLFTSSGFIKEENIGSSLFYKGTGKRDDFSKIFRCIFYLEKQEWFMAYVEKWLYYNSDRNSSEDDFDIEDILEQSRRKLEKLSNVI